MFGHVCPVEKNGRCNKLTVNQARVPSENNGKRCIGHAHPVWSFKSLKRERCGAKKGGREVGEDAGFFKALYARLLSKRGVSIRPWCLHEVANIATNLFPCIGVFIARSSFAECFRFLTDNFLLPMTCCGSCHTKTHEDD